MPIVRSGGRSGSSGEEGGASARGSARPKASERKTAGAGRVAAARERILRGMLSPLNMVLLSRNTIEDLFDDAVNRGRMTRSDAQDMAQSLLSRGARATDDFLADLERMLGSRADSFELSPDDGLNTPKLPIAGYDELSAAQVQERLEGLTPAELRKLHDYEQRHANRKTVLDRIERRLR